MHLFYLINFFCRSHSKFRRHPNRRSIKSFAGLASDYSQLADGGDTVAIGSASTLESAAFRHAEQIDSDVGGCTDGCLWSDHCDYWCVALEGAAGG